MISCISSRSGRFAWPETWYLPPLSSMTSTPISEGVHDADDAALVARDRLRGEQEQVALLHLDPQILAARQLRGGRAPLALASRSRAASGFPRHPAASSGVTVDGEVGQHTGLDRRRIIRFIARPSRQTDRPAARPASASVFTRATFEAKVVATTMPPRPSRAPGSRPQRRLRPARRPHEGVGRVADSALTPLARDLAQSASSKGSPTTASGPS
jgi:hypothetical protein